MTKGNVFQCETLKQSKFQVTLENSRGNEWLQQKFAIQIALFSLLCRKLFASTQNKRILEQEKSHLMLKILIAQEWNIL